MSIITTAMYDDEEPQIIFSEEEKPNLPEESLAMLISAAKQCYHFLNPAKLKIDMREGITIFIHSVDCAAQIVQHGRDMDIAALSATIDITQIEETLPILVTAIEESLSIGNDACTDMLADVQFALGLIGTKLYPGGLDEDGVSGYRDIFPGTDYPNSLKGDHA